MSYRAQRVAALVLLVVFFPSVAMATAYALRPVRKPLVVYALDRHHHVLAPGSKLAAGQHITVVAKGFRPRTRVQVVDTSRRRIVFVHADSSGVARKSFVVPGRKATHLAVDLAGLIAHGRGVTPPPVRASARRAPAPVLVSVPLLRKYPYAIRGGRGVDAGGVGLGPGSHTGDGGGSQLADTGFDVLGLVAAGVLLVVLGASVTRRGRSRPIPEGAP